ncbi:hypothetical protein [Streptomyces eurythermus]|uniref:hypothetical protein n=1 Tax=Streptomyces eurythermus TaxID=42237 RepID=UPI0033C4FB49
MICTRCDQPIRDDEPYETVPHYGASGAGATLHVHVRACDPVPQQTYPSRYRGGV